MKLCPCPQTAPQSHSPGLPQVTGNPAHRLHHSHTALGSLRSRGTLPTDCTTVTQPWAPSGHGEPCPQTALHHSHTALGSLRSRGTLPTDCTASQSHSPGLPQVTGNPAHRLHCTTVTQPWAPSGHGEPCPQTLHHSHTALGSLRSRGTLPTDCTTVTQPWAPSVAPRHGEPLWGTVAGSRGTTWGTVAGSRGTTWGTVAGSRGTTWGTVAGSRGTTWGTVAGSRGTTWGTVAGSRGTTWGTVAGSRGTTWGTVAPRHGEPLWGTVAGSRGTTWGTVAGSRGTTWGTVAGSRGTTWGTVAGSRGTTWGTVAGSRGTTWGTVAGSRGTTWGTVAGCGLAQRQTPGSNPVTSNRGLNIWCPHGFPARCLASITGSKLRLVGPVSVGSKLDLWFLSVAAPTPVWEDSCLR